MTSLFKGWQKTIAALTLIVFSTQIVGCFSQTTDTLDQPYQQLVRYLEQEEQQNFLPDSSVRVAWARLLKTAVHSAQDQLEELPSLEGRLTADPEQARQFVLANQSKLMSWANQVDEKSLAIRKLIFDISKHAYESSDSRVIARDYSLLFFALQYQRVLYKTLIQGFSALALVAGAPEFSEVREVSEFKREMLSRYFSYLGMGIVIRNDLAKTAQVLGNYRKGTELPAPMWKFLTDSQSATVSQAQVEMEPVNQALSQLSEEQRTQLQGQLQSATEAFKNVSLLYHPKARASTTFNIISWVGNLTWGLVNTMIGVGIVLTTIVVSPFTRYVDFPTFRIAASGSQIYVDVTGMSSIAGKMSMGLFELDNATNYFFASDHEGAHAIQSAILGPLYLPVVLGSYLIFGFDRGFMEDWAWNWSRY